MLDQYQDGRGVVRPWLGIALREPYWARGGLTNTVGLLVTTVHPLGAGAIGEFSVAVPPYLPSGYDSETDDLF